MTFQYFEFIVKVILFPVQCQLQSDKNYKCLDINPPNTTTTTTTA